MIRTVIFDMDGTMVDNLSYHKTAWIEYCREKGALISINDFDKVGFGLTSEHYIRAFLNPDAVPEEIALMDKEKEAVYRNLYKPHIKPVKGLLPLLEELKNNGFIMAVATSAIPENLDFVLDMLGIRRYFKALVDVTQISRPKPDPEIFITVAKRLGEEPKECLVFEDSGFGISAALAAGMKVIAINTGKNKDKFNGVSMIIDDFTSITKEVLEQIMND